MQPAMPGMQPMQHGMPPVQPMQHGMPPVQHGAPAMPQPAMPPQPMAYGQAAAYSYGFSYAPGTRVNVTWSNGQRYPGTVQQVSGSQCLVVFPDGQHHWVEMQYIAPV